MDNRFFKSFHIAGFGYYQGAFVFEHLRIGSRILLKTDPGNRHDEYAVELYFEDKKIGFVPRSLNKEMSTILQAGHDIFECVVQQIAPNEHPEQQVRVAIFVKVAEQA